jgi:hypothetical protein
MRPRLASRFTYPFPPTSGNAYARGALDRLLPLDAAAWPLTADYYLNMLAPFYGEVVSLDATLGRYRVHGGNHWVGFRPTVEERLVRDVAQTLLVEQRVRELAAETGLPVAPDLSLADSYYAVLRLALRVIAPGRYPKPNETALWLARRGFRTLLRGPVPRDAASLLRRLHLGAWFALLPVLPTAAARRVARETLVARRSAQYGARARRAA